MKKNYQLSICISSILFVGCLLSFSSPYSKDDILWIYKENYPNHTTSMANSCIQTKNKNIAIAGYVQTSLTNKDFYFEILNQDGKPIKEPFVERKLGDDEAHQIIQTHDGGFVLVGYVTTPLSEATTDLPTGKNNCILKYTADGQLLWANYYGSTEKADELQTVVQLNNGNIVAAGTSGGQGYIVKVDAKGQFIKEAFVKEVTIIRAITDNLKGKLTYLGNNSAKVYVFQADEDLSVSNPRPINKTNINIGEDLFYDFKTQKKYVLLGSPNFNEEGTIELFHFQGATPRLYGNLNERHYENHATAMTPLPSGKTLIVGYTRWDEEGYKTLFYNPLIVIIDEKGKEISSITGLESKGSDMIKDVCLQDDGSIIFVGTSPLSKNSDKKAWVVKLKGEQNNLPTIPSIDSIGVSKPVLKDIGMPEPNDTLNGKERAYIAFDLTNSTLESYYGLQANIDIISPLKNDIQYNKQVLLGSLSSKSTKTYSIPFNASPFLSSGTIDVDIRLQTQDNQEVAFPSINVVTKKAPRPILEIGQGTFSFRGRDSSLYRETPVQLEVSLTNTGKGDAENVQLEFSLPYLVDPLNKSIFSLGDLPKDSTVHIRFPFQASYLYPNNLIDVKCRALEQGTTTSTVYRSFKLPIRSFTDFELPNSLVKDTISRKRWELKARGPNVEDIIVKPTTEKNIKWLFSLNPDDQERLRKKILSKSGHYDTPHFRREVTLMVQIQTNGDTLSSSDIELEINNIGQGWEVASQDVLYDDTLHFDPASNSYRYIMYIHLVKGQNNFRVRLKEGGKTKVFKIECILPALHLFFAGIDHRYHAEPLNYSGSSAVQFCDTIEKYAKNLFRRINPVVLADSITTLEDSLRKVFDKDIFVRRVQKMTTSEKDGDLTSKGIYPFDYIIIFIASHQARTQYNGFSIQTSEGGSYRIDHLLDDFSDFYHEKTFVFIDACNSGQLINSMAYLPKRSSQAADTLFNDFASFADNLYLFTSSQSNQASWQPSKYKASIFAKALIEAFSCQECEVAEGAEGVEGEKMKACGSDKLLTVHELKIYLEKRVRYLSKDKMIQEPNCNLTTKDGTLLSQDK